MQKGEQLDTALKRLDEVAKLVDIDLSQFSSPETSEAEKNILNDEVASTKPNSEVEEEEPKDEVVAAVNNRQSQEEE